VKHDLQPVGRGTARGWSRTTPLYRCQACGRPFASLFLATEPYDVRELDDCPGEQEAPVAEIHPLQS
jgi:hypothetical protein